MRALLRIPARLRRWIFAVLLCCVFAVVFGVGYFLVWVAMGPRSLATFVPAMESALSATDGSYKAKIDEAWLTWDSWQHPMDIRLRNVEIRTPDGQMFARFPEVSMGLDIPSLLVGSVAPHSLVIQRPVLSLYQNADRTLSFGFQEMPEQPTAQAEAAEDALENMQAPLGVVLQGFLNPGSFSQFRHLDYVAVKDADLSIGNKAKGVFFTADHFNASLTRGVLSVRAGFDLQLSYANTRSPIRGQFNLKRGADIIDGKMEAEDVRPSELANFFLDDSPLQGIDLPVNAVVLAKIKTDGTLINGQFALTGGPGTVAHPKLEETLSVDRIEAGGDYDFASRMLKVEKLRLELGAMEANFNGHVGLTPQQESLVLNGTLTNAKATDVRRFWPLGVSPMSREWVTTNILGGTIPQASIAMNVPPGALQKPVLPDEAVDARLSMKGAQIRYLPDHPPVTAITGTVRVTGQTLVATLESGTTMKETQLSNGTVAINDLNADNPRIEVKFDADSTGGDLSKFMALPTFSHLKQLNLAHDSLRGKASGRVELAFDFFAPRDAQGRPLDAEVIYAIKGNVKGAGGQQFMHKFDVADADGVLAMDNKGVTFEGQGSVNRVPLALKVRYSDAPKDGMDTFVEFKASNAPVDALPSFGVQAIKGVSGRVDAEGTVESGEHKTVVTAKGSIADAEVLIADLGASKPLGVPGTLALKAVMEEGKPVEISGLDLASEPLTLKGSATVTDDFDKNGKVVLSTLRSGQTNCALTYENADGMRRIDVSGQAFDATSQMKGSGEFSFEHFPPTDLKADLALLILGEKRQITKFKGVLYCTAARCERANLEGEVSDQPFYFRISGPPGDRVLSARAEDAGALLRTLDIMDSVEGGKLSLDGKYAQSASILNATLRMQNFTMVNAPVLAKLLTLVSLTGALDTLQGKGIAFERLSAPFTLQNDVITLKEARTHGPALGMTADGTIRFPGAMLDLKGTVVPSYTLNSVLGNVPIVGAVLTGGDKNSGVFAARYTMTGGRGEPEISVNPLSMLTPGFLRNMFDIFDKPAQKQGEDPEPKEYPSQR